MGSKKRSARANRSPTSWRTSATRTMLSPEKESASCSRSGSTNPPCAERHASRKSAISTAPTPKRPSAPAPPMERPGAMLSLPLLRRLAPHLEARMRGRLPISRHRERGRLTKGKGVDQGDVARRLWIPATSPRSHGFRFVQDCPRRGGRRKQRGMSFRRLWMWWTTRRGSLHHRVSKRGDLLVRERFRAPIDICYLRLTIRERQQRLGNVCQGLQFLHISQRGAPCRARRR